MTDLLTQWSKTVVGVQYTVTVTVTVHTACCIGSQVQTDEEVGGEYVLEFRI
jgi:hypothetical protein